MTVRLKLVWKLVAVVVTILVAAIAISGYVNNLICTHYSLESARESMRFNAESINKGIGQLMMSRNNQRIKELIVDISRDSTVYGDIRLVSHHSGEVVASRFEDNLSLKLGDPACTVCHRAGGDVRDDLGVVDMVIDLPGGSRELSVVAPIINQPGCRDAACHVHLDAPPILGFLNVDYSLDRVDTMTKEQRLLILVTVLASLTVSVVALWFMFSRLLERPISGLVAGTKRIADNEMDFRFDETRHDEIGVLERSFNSMMTTIQANQAELLSAKEYLEGIVENSADLIITVTPDGLIETFNRGAEQALGYSRQEVIGGQIETLFVDPRERDVAIARLKDTDNVRNIETRFRAKDGQVRNVLLTLSRLRDRQGAAIGTMGISKDVTQEKTFQRELMQSQRFAAIGQAVTGIQHAIKNMLNALKGGSYLVRNGMVKDDHQRIEEGWAMIEEGIDRIGSLSVNMLNFAKEWKLELERIDLNDLLSKIRDLHRPTAAEQGVSTRCETAHDLPAVLCDPERIHMAVTDLLVNAIDACAWKDYRQGEKPEIVLKSSLSEGGDFLLIEVRDNGCGMDDEIRRNIFTPFFSTKNTLGSGLGLALTARIINVHGGEISVESEPDRGAVFRIHLPVNGPSQSRERIDG